MPNDAVDAVNSTTILTTPSAANVGSDFTLAPQLKADCFEVAQLTLSTLLLLNNYHVPWLILVPRCSNLTELTDLSASDQIELLAEINQITQLQNALFTPDKINTAAIGNVVSQLHIHIIGRYHNDPVWPAPVWGNIEALPYTKIQADQRINAIKKHLQSNA